MERHSELDHAGLVHRLRTALLPALPYGPTLIPLDILVTVVQAANNGKRMSVKDLCEALPYSVTGVRYNIHQLIQDGWLSKARYQEDRRMVHLLPTAKGKRALSEVCEQLSDYLHQ